MPFVADANVDTRDVLSLTSRQKIQAALGVGLVRWQRMLDRFLGAEDRRQVDDAVDVFGELTHIRRAAHIAPMNVWAREAQAELGPLPCRSKITTSWPVMMARSAT